MLPRRLTLPETHRPLITPVFSHNFEIGSGLYPQWRWNLLSALGESFDPVSSLTFSIWYSTLENQCVIRRDSTLDRAPQTGMGGSQNTHQSPRIVIHSERAPRSNSREPLHKEGPRWLIPVLPGPLSPKRLNLQIGNNTVTFKHY